MQTKNSVFVMANFSDAKNKTEDTRIFLFKINYSVTRI